MDPWEKKKRKSNPPASEDAIDPREKKTQIKPTDEMGNTLCDRRNGVVNKGLSARRNTRVVKTKPTSAVASLSIRLDRRPVAVSIAVGERGWPSTPPWVELLDRSGCSDNDNESGLQTGRAGIWNVVWRMDECLGRARVLATVSPLFASEATMRWKTIRHARTPNVSLLLTVLLLSGLPLENTFAQGVVGRLPVDRPVARRDANSALARQQYARI